MRRPTVFLVVFLVLTAGCANFLPWSQSHSSSQTQENTLEYPPGVNSEWIVASDQLLRAHEKALNQTAYQLEARLRSNHGANIPGWANSTLTVHQGNHRTKVQETGDVAAFNGSNSPYIGYVWNGKEIRRESDPVGPKYSYTHSARPSVAETNRRVVTEQIETILSGGDFLANGTQSQNGTTLYQYKTTGKSSQSGIQSMNATVLIDQSGMIHELHGVLEPSGVRTAQVSFSYSFSRVARPPSRPSWINRMPHLRVTTTDAGALRIDQTGGKAIPAGTNISFAVTNNSTLITGRATFPKQLRPDESAYLTVTNTSRVGRELHGNGTLTVNHPSQMTNETIRIAPRSGGIFAQTKKWRVSVSDTTPVQTANRSSKN